MSSSSLNRRQFLRGSGLGLAGLYLAGMDGLARPALADNSRIPVPRPAEAFVPDAVVDITPKEKYVQVVSGSQTKVWSYEGQVSGSAVSLQTVPGSYLGPVLRAKKGTNVRINLHNGLNEDTVLHPHGLRVPEDCDGQPMQAIGPGATKVYAFQVIDRACPAWFHQAGHPA